MFGNLKRKAVDSFRRQKNRCYNYKNPAYKYYGAKGIDIKYSKEDFIKWFINNHPKTNDKWSIGRIDHDKGYSFDNIIFQKSSENTMERILRRGTTKKKRKVIIHDLISGEDVFIAESAMDAGKLVGITQGNLSGHCSGKIKQTKNNFKLRYADNVDVDKIQSL